MGQVGTIFARALRNMGIRYETSDKCNCYQCMVDLNREQPEEVERRIDYWERRVQLSSQEWFQHKLENGRYMVQALRPAARKGIRPLLLWACKKAKGT